jgi:hypothetical protein
MSFPLEAQAIAPPHRRRTLRHFRSGWATKEERPLRAIADAARAKGHTISHEGVGRPEGGEERVVKLNPSFLNVPVDVHIEWPRAQATIAFGEWEIIAFPPSQDHDPSLHIELTRRALRGPGESYSDVIVRLAEEAMVASARCLIPGFDGAIFSVEWRDALWAKFYTEAP